MAHLYQQKEETDATLLNWVPLRTITCQPSKAAIERIFEQSLKLRWRRYETIQQKRQMEESSRDLHEELTLPDIGLNPLD